MRHLKVLMKHALPGSGRAWIRKKWARSKTLRHRGRLSEAQFREILVERLGIKPGSTLLVHCSFGNLKAQFSPSDAVAILIDIVGEEGTLLMPYYPGCGIEALENGAVFDARCAKTSTGILARELASHADSRISLHPIKAVVGWGRHRDFLLSQHSNSVTPYDESSPYFRMLQTPLPLCIGLGTDKNAFVHSCEDNIPEHPKDHYHPKQWKGRCIGESGEEVVVQTMVHKREGGWTVGSGQFLERTGCPSHSRITVHGRTFYRVEAHDMFEHIRGLARNNIFRSKGINQ